MNETQTNQTQEQTKICKHCKTAIPKKAKVCPNCRKKQGGILKWILIIFVALIIIGAIAGGGNDSSNDSSNTTSSSSVDKNDGTKKEASGLTEEKYNSIEQGMTYDEVVGIIGEEGTNISEVELGGITTVVYEWTASDGWGNANITFQDNKVVNKAQFGVDSGDNVEITMEQYNAVATGMTYEEVVGVLGGEGALLSDTEVSGMTAQIYMWEGTSLGSNANITFSDGKVIAKAQTGLE